MFDPNIHVLAISPLGSWAVIADGGIPFEIYCYDYALFWLLAANLPPYDQPRSGPYEAFSLCCYWSYNDI